MNNLFGLLMCYIAGNLLKFGASFLDEKYAAELVEAIKKTVTE